MSGDAGEVKAAAFEESWRPAWTPLLIIAFPVLPFFWSYHVKLEGDDLHFGYSTRYTSAHIRVRDITKVEVLDNIRPLRDFGGWGLRINTEGTIAYVAEAGSGIEISMTDGSKRIFNVRDAARLAALLQPGDAPAARPE